MNQMKLKSVEKKTSDQKQRSFGKALIGGTWSVTDKNGTNYTSDQFEKNQNSYYIIYFGFTNCPDICPNSMNKMSKMYKKL